MHQFLTDQVCIIIDNDMDIVCIIMVMIVDDEIQLEELDALKADLLSLQASVHKLVCCLPCRHLELVYFIAASIY